MVAAGSGLLFAQTSSPAVNTVVLSVASVIGTGGIVGLIKVWVEQRNIAERYEARIKLMAVEADREHTALRREIEEKGKQIDEGAQERKRIEERHAIEHDLDVIQIQDLKLGEEWLKIQLRLATGKEVPPKPALFTPEAEKVLGSSGIMPNPMEIPPGKNILIVDDSASSILSLKRFLRYYGWNVRSAATVAQALHLIKEQRPDIVMTDLLMPGTNGTELVRTIRDEGDITTKIIVLTAYPGHVLIDEVRTLGVDEVVVKPYDPQRLLDLITPIEEAKDPSEYGR